MTWSRSLNKTDRWESLRRGTTVDECYHIAIKLGAKDEGKPGSRHGKDYYAYFRDLDGNKICIFKKLSS